MSRQCDCGRRRAGVLLALACAAWATLTGTVAIRASDRAPGPAFQTSDRCLACHNGLQTAAGDDVSIGFDWHASIMANSSRDPYWQASVRRESIDRPPLASHIQDECAICHMPIARYEAKLAGRAAEVFAHLPFTAPASPSRAAEDGVSCSVCHQISRQGLGSRDSFNGGFVVEPPDADGAHPEYGPFAIERGQTTIMRSSSEGYRPTQSAHIRQSEVCATCHTLFTDARDADGRVLGTFPEQVPYQEWLHSEFKDRQSCQSCHMPAVGAPAPIARVLGVPREGMARHTFVGANFFMQRMLNRYRDELSVDALPQELTDAAGRTVRYLEGESASLSIDNAGLRASRFEADVVVSNLGGHKLPTAYPSRRAWLHVIVRDASGGIVFESGGLNPDGSIVGNDNDADGARFEPHYREITAPEQVQIYEPILGDANGAVTTGLLSAVRYLKDNRLLPRGFDKRTADQDIAVRGEAADDPDFSGGGDRVHYAVGVDPSRGPFRIEAELLYQPIGFRWANNLKKYKEAAEPRRFTGYYDAMSGAATARLASANEK